MASVARVVGTVLTRITSSSACRSHIAGRRRTGQGLSQLDLQFTRVVAMRYFSKDSDNTEDLKFGGVYDPEDMTPPIPPYVEKQGESTELKRARLLYQSRKRGMLENGLLLSTFAGKHLDSLSEAQLADYDKLINQPTNDWEIYYWVTEAKETPEEFQSDVMEMLKKHAKNEDRDIRISQPDLSAQ